MRLQSLLRRLCSILLLSRQTKVLKLKSLYGADKGMPAKDVKNASAGCTPCARPDALPPGFCVIVLLFPAFPAAAAASP